MELISAIDFGSKVWDPQRKCLRPSHQNTKAEVVASYQRRCHDLSPIYLDTLRHRDIINHCSGAETWYASGNQSRKADCTLVLIDIDAGKAKGGTKEGAEACAAFLKSKYKNLYLETSTHGLGIHGFVVLYGKKGLDAEVVNELLKRWNQQLRKDCAGFDIADVEVKMTLPVQKWGSDKYDLQAYTTGQLGKLPREFLDRFEEFQNTTRLHVDELRRLPVLEKSKPVVASSIRGTLIDVSRYEGHLALARRLFAGRVLETTSRAVATYEDGAVFQLITEYCSSDMNADGSMPTARIRKWWELLYSQGAIDRPWNPNRYKAVRDFYSSLGLIEWSDPSYQVGTTDHTGEYQKGQAARWQLSAAFMAELQKIDAAEHDKEREEEPFDITEFSKFVENLVEVPKEEVVRPTETLKMHLMVDRITELVEMYALAV